LYFRRDHPERGDRRATIPALCTNLDPRRAGQSTARLVGEYGWRYLEAIAHAPLSRGDRLACYRILVSHLARSGFHRVIKRNSDPLFVAGGPTAPGNATIKSAGGASTS
jgi:hypothetical protein